jgi:Kef-type K+ transport system membrane component KefB/Trk K+ transport system NAD-binding subunit
MEGNPFIGLLLITILALLVPILASRMRRVQIPIVVGEILAGMAIGHSGLNLVEPSATLDFLAEFGFAFLMFLSGLEVDFNLLTPDLDRKEDTPFWRRPLPISLLMFLGTLALAFGISMGLEDAGMVQSPLLMALILSTTSLGVVVPVLKEKGILTGRYGQAMLVSASISDFATLLLLTVVIAFNRRGLTLDLLLIPALLAIFGILARLSQQISSDSWLIRLLNELSSATAQLRVRGAFALMVAWVVLAEALGVELILGAFLAGAIAGLLDEETDAASQEKLDAMGYGFFIPIFFIMVGAEFDLSALLSSPQAMLLVPILLIASYMVKLLPSLLLRLNFDWRHTIAGGILLSSRLSLVIAASAIAVGIGAISEEVNAATVLLAVVTCTLSPSIFNRLVSRPEEDRRHGVIIVGTDQMVPLLARRLRAEGEQVAIVSTREAAEEGYFQDEGEVIYGDPADEGVLAQAKAEEAEGLVALCTNPNETRRVLAVARERFQIPILVARVGEVEGMSNLRDEGVRVVQPAIATAIALQGALWYPTTFDLLVDQEDGVEVRDAVMNNVDLRGSRIRGLRLPGNALVLSIRRDGSVLVPDGETRLKIGDRVGIIGSHEALEDTIEFFRGRGRGARSAGNESMGMTLRAGE